MAFLARSALLGVLFFALAGPASAASCWQRLMLDWCRRLGRQDVSGRVLPPGDHPPEADLQIYSSASDDIRRALQRVVTKHGEPPSSDPLPQERPPVAVGATGKGSSVPRPLLVLGGVALLLVAAGLAGMVWRRSQGNRPGTP